MWDYLNIYLKNIICSVICLFFLRIFIVYLRVHNRKKIKPRRKSCSSKLMIILGSGGHTFEMLHLIRNIGEKFRPRVYIIANTDSLSEQKLKSFEGEAKSEMSLNLYTIEKIPRSREVGQSWLSTAFTTLLSCIVAFKLIFNHKPEAILCNGPGTCVPLCLAAFCMHVLGVKHIIIIYVESICRVKTMSLSGKILYYISDQFLVQWPELIQEYPRAKYIGKLL